MKGAIALALALALAFAAGGCQAEGERREVGAPPQPQLVLLYATCTLNKRYLSPYDPSIPFTPSLQRFAEDSVVFQAHRTEAGMSGVAFASIFSGNQAPGHGIFTHPTRLDDSVYLITELYGDDGYDTWFWGGHGMASPELNYAQGVPEEHWISTGLVSPGVAFQGIMERLKAEPDYRAFIVTNFTLTHGPYEPEALAPFCGKYPTQCSPVEDIPGEERRRFDDLNRSNQPAFKYNFREAAAAAGLAPDEIPRFAAYLEVLYRANVERLDARFGRILDAIHDAGLDDVTLVAFTADHGESLHDDASIFSWSHAFTMQADTLDVPLIIRAPTAAVAPGRAAYVTRSIDLFPTLAGLSGLALPDGITIEGHDLSGAMRGLDPPPELLAFSHSGVVPRNLVAEPDARAGHLKSLFPGADMEHAWVAVRSGDMVWKRRRLEDGRWRTQAYDLEADPRETNDLFDPASPLNQRMAEDLTEYKKALVASWHDWEAARNGDAGISTREQIERLRSLGYIQ